MLFSKSATDRCCLSKCAFFLANCRAMILLLYGDRGQGWEEGRMPKVLTKFVDFYSVRSKSLSK